MRYSAFVLALAVVAVVITACRQEQAGGRPLRACLSVQPQGNSNPQVSQQPRAAADSQPGSKAQAGEQSRPDQAPGAGQGTGADEEPLLLLDDDEEESPAANGEEADNSRCHHCHLNYIDEKLAVVHAKANIGCADCHGNCDEHIADESWASGGKGTPPEIMYPREKVNPFCLGCHPKDKLGALEHKLFLAGTAKEKHCTDCHGDHRLAKRRCKWR